MIQEIIWSNISVAGMAFLTLGTLIVVVCVGVGFMIQIRHRGKKNERTTRHAPGSSRDRGRISPESELGQKLVNLNFKVNPGKVYKPLVEAKKMATPVPAAPRKESREMPAEKPAEEKPALRRAPPTPEPVVAKPVPSERVSPPPVPPVEERQVESRPPASVPVPLVEPRPTASVETRPVATADPAAVELTNEEQEAILKIQEMLGLPTARVVLSVPQIEAILACGRALQKELKPIPVKDVILDPGEKAFFEFTADLLEITSGGGVRLHFPPEFYLDVFRGIITSSPPAQKIETGRLIITSRRVLFVGSNRTLAMSYDLITGMDLFIDLLRINSVGKDRVCVMGVENPPLVALAISYAYRDGTG